MKSALSHTIYTWHGTFYQGGFLQLLENKVARADFVHSLATGVNFRVEFQTFTAKFSLF